MNHMLLKCSKYCRMVYLLIHFPPSSLVSANEKKTRFILYTSHQQSVYKHKKKKRAKSFLCHHRMRCCDTFLQFSIRFTLISSVFNFRTWMRYFQMNFELMQFIKAGFHTILLYGNILSFSFSSVVRVVYQQRLLCLLEVRKKKLQFILLFCIVADE